MSDIVELLRARLQTHVGWLAKGLIGLATVSAIVLGWLIINLYTPMKDLSKDVAVQTALLGAMKDQIKSVADKLDKIDDNSQRSPAAGQAGPVHSGTQQRP